MEEIHPEITNKLRQEITEGFDTLCAEVNGEEIQTLMGKAQLAINYAISTHRASLSDENDILMEMEPFTMSALAWLVNYAAARFQEPEDFMAVLLGFYLLYIKVFHHVMRMSWMMRQDGKTTTEIEEFMWGALPELFRQTYNAEQYRGIN